MKTQIVTLLKQAAPRFDSSEAIRINALADKIEQTPDEQLSELFSNLSYLDKQRIFIIARYA